MDEWEKFNETLPKKEEFHINLNIEDITDADYMHTKKVCKDFEIKSKVNIMICILTLFRRWGGVKRPPVPVFPL